MKKKILAITLLTICGGVTLGTAANEVPSLIEVQAGIEEYKTLAIQVLDEYVSRFYDSGDYEINIFDILDVCSEGKTAIQNATSEENVANILKQYMDLIDSFPDDNEVISTLNQEADEIGRILTQELDIESFCSSVANFAIKVNELYEDFYDCVDLESLKIKVNIMETFANRYSRLLDLNQIVEEHSTSEETIKNVSDFIYHVTIDYYAIEFYSDTIDEDFDLYEADIKRMARSIFDNLDKLEALPGLIDDLFKEIDDTEEYKTKLANIKEIYNACITNLHVELYIQYDYEILVDSSECYFALSEYVKSFEETFNNSQMALLQTCLATVKLAYRSKCDDPELLFDETMSSLEEIVKYCQAEVDFENYKQSHQINGYIKYQTYNEYLKNISNNFYDEISELEEYSEISLIVSKYCDQIDSTNYLFAIAEELYIIVVQLTNFEYSPEYKAKLDRAAEICETLPDDIFFELVGSNYLMANIANVLWNKFDACWNTYLAVKGSMSIVSQSSFENDFAALIKYGNDNYQMNSIYQNMMVEKIDELTAKITIYLKNDAINEINQYYDNNKKFGVNYYFDGLYNTEALAILENYTTQISEATSLDVIESLKDAFKDEIVALDNIYNKCISFAEMYEACEFEFTEEFKDEVSHILGVWEYLPKEAKDWISPKYDISKLSGFQLYYLSLKSLMNNYMNEYQGVCDAIDKQFELMFNEAIELCKVDDPNADYFISCVSQRLYYMVEFTNYINNHVDHNLINSTEVYKEKFDEVLDEAYDVIRTADYSQLLPTVSECTNKVDDFIKDLKEIEDIKTKIQSVKDFEYSSTTISKINDLLSQYERDNDFVKEIIGDDIQYVLLAKQTYEALDNIDYIYYNTYRDYMTDDQREHFFGLFNNLYDTLYSMIQNKENMDSVIDSATTEITEYFEYCEELYEAKNETYDYIYYAVQHTEGLYLLDNKDEIFNAWRDRVRNATNTNELDQITSEVTTFMNRQLAKFEIDQAMSDFGFHYDDELIKSYVEDWYSSLELVTKKDDCLAIADRAKEEICSIYQDLAKQEIEDYLAGLDQSFWTDEMKEKTEKGKQSYFNKIDDSDEVNEINKLVKQAKEKLGKFAKPVPREEKGCNKGTGAIVIISIVVIVAVTLTICLTAGKKGKKTNKKSKK